MTQPYLMLYFSKGCIYQKSYENPIDLAKDLAIKENYIHMGMNFGNIGNYKYPMFLLFENDSIIECKYKSEDDTFQLDTFEMRFDIYRFLKENGFHKRAESFKEFMLNETKYSKKFENIMKFDEIERLFIKKGGKPQ